MRLVLCEKELGKVPVWLGTLVLLLLSKPFVELMFAIAFDVGLADHHSFKTEHSGELHNLLLRIGFFRRKLVAWNENDSQLG